MKHRIRVCGIARQDDQIVLIQQINPKTGSRRWGVPGGGLEITDDDIFRAVEREMFEESGLRVRANQLRFISEYFDPSDQMLMVTFWLECHPEGVEHNELSLDNNVPGDHIEAVRWWSKQEIQDCDDALMNRMIRRAEFWEGLETPPGVVTHLGRS
jgi:ADP-ribose pyrophosphatase YjhB (NUDIX family)